jgi:hypothetical protein
MSGRYRKGERFRVTAKGVPLKPFLIDESTAEENQHAVLGLLESERLRFVCAWCQTFDPHDPNNKDASHGMCPSCAAKFAKEW